MSCLHPADPPIRVARDAVVRDEVSPDATCIDCGDPPESGAIRCGYCNDDVTHVVRGTPHASLLGTALVYFVLTEVVVVVILALVAIAIRGCA